MKSVGRGLRVADDHPGHRARRPARRPTRAHLAGDLAVREVPVDPVADADLLDGDQGVGYPLEHRVRRPARASNVTVVQRPRPAGSGRSPRRCSHHRAVAAVAGRPSSSAITGDAEGGPAASRARRARPASTRGAPRRTRPGGDLLGRVRRRRPTSSRVPSMSSATSRGRRRLTSPPAHRARAYARVPAGRAAAPRARAPSRPPAGGSRGSRRWCG